MTDEEQLISHFYTSMQKLDWKGMLDCYQENIFFYDPVFENLEGEAVRAMWEMLLRSAKGLELTFSDLTGDDGYGSCHWVATYTFSQTGRRVVNKGKAFFTFSGGRIIEHQDDFSLWKWSAQALGLTGWLFGWSSAVKGQIRAKARKSLEKFMAGRPQSAMPSQD
jgi:hypothetical protein